MADKIVVRLWNTITDEKSNHHFNKNTQVCELKHFNWNSENVIYVNNQPLEYVEKQTLDEIQEDGMVSLTILECLDFCIEGMNVANITPFIRLKNEICFGEWQRIVLASTNEKYYFNPNNKVFAKDFSYYILYKNIPKIYSNLWIPKAQMPKQNIARAHRDAENKVVYIIDDERDTLS